ncbi:hypothetical protein CLOM_g13139 [Closterium sp. NIES-68]|nr:hypothetical protein CLOM_g13139 [Closterium sp. NIES-68]
MWRRGLARRVGENDLPPGLPPERPQDHQIELEPDAQPSLDTVAADAIKAPGTTGPAGLLVGRGVRSTEHVPIRSPDPVHTQEDGGLRMCIDYRALNRVTIKSLYPISRADELIDHLRGAHYFSKIHLRGGYHQIRVLPQDRNSYLLRELRIHYHAIRVNKCPLDVPAGDERGIQRITR